MIRLKPLEWGPIAEGSQDSVAVCGDYVLEVAFSLGYTRNRIPLPWFSIINQKYMTSSWLGPFETEAEARKAVEESMLKTLLEMVEEAP